MNIRFVLMILVFCVCVLTAGCSALLSQQEWSDNYALLDGVHSTNIQMTDGDLNTVGVTGSSDVPRNRVGRNSSSSPEVIITLPEKKVIRRIVIHSDNIKKFNIYADKGGSALSKTDWQLIKEEKSVKSGPIVVPVLYAYPTDKIRIVVLGTTDDGAMTRREVARGVQSALLSSQSGST